MGCTPLSNPALDNKVRSLPEDLIRQQNRLAILAAERAQYVSILGSIERHLDVRYFVILTLDLGIGRQAQDIEIAAAMLLVSALHFIQQMPQLLLVEILADGEAANRKVGCCGQ